MKIASQTVQQYIDEFYPWPKYQRISCATREVKSLMKAPYWAKFIEAVPEDREDINGKPYKGYVVIWQYLL